MTQKLPGQGIAGAALPDEPSVHEHGVNGYTDAAVGGFGESYGFQVAHGGEGEAPDTTSNSERQEHETPADERLRALERAVAKALAQAHVDAADVRVEALGSAVRLRGTVRYLVDRADLEALARAVPGVSSVSNDLMVLVGDRTEQR